MDERFDGLKSAWCGRYTDHLYRNLNGFTDVIRTVFPLSQTQICVVHAIRNSTQYVTWKDKKQFCSEMKHIYTAPNKASAEAALQDFKKSWEAKAPYAIKSFWKSEIFNPEFLIAQEGRYKGYPYRTFSGNVFQNGFSDHFPTLIYLVKKLK